MLKRKLKNQENKRSKKYLSMALAFIFFSSFLINWNIPKFQAAITPVGRVSDAEVNSLRGTEDSLFGIAGDFDIFINGDCTATGSDCQGRMAVGGTFYPRQEYYDIGSGRRSEVEGRNPKAILIANGLDGKIGGANRKVVIQDGGTGITPRSESNAAVYTSDSNKLINFQQVFHNLKVINERIGKIKPNGKIQKNERGYTFTGDDLECNVFEADSLVTESITADNESPEWRINVPEGSAIVINITGTNVKMQAASVMLNGKHVDQDSEQSTWILYNYPNASKVKLCGSLVGSHLAPKAAGTSGGNGHISGEVIFDSFCGSIEFGLTVFKKSKKIIPKLSEGKEEATGIVKLKKVDADNTAKTLSGAQFSVYKDANKDGLPDKDSEEIKLVEEKDGVYSRKLALGDYVLIEKVAPADYNVDSSYYKFTITKNAETVIKNDKSGYFEDSIKKGSAALVKVDENDVYKKLEGAKFKVYKDVNSNGKYDADIDTPLSNNDFDGNETDGEGKFTLDNLDYGNYLIKEVQAPEGYNLDLEYRPFRVNADLVQIRNSENGYFTNTKKPEKTTEPEKKTGSVEIKKVDEITKNKLTGAKFTVYKDVNGDKEYEDETDTEVGTLIESDGIYTMDKLEAGQYLVKETEAPEGYIEDAKYYDFIVDDEGSKTEVTNDLDKTCFTNTKKPEKTTEPEKKTGSVEIKKVDEITKNKLTGAKFTVYKDVNGDKEYEDETDTEVGTLIESDGIYTMDKLEAGQYLVKETEAPEGYIEDAKYYDFIVDDEGSKTEVTNDLNKTCFTNTKKSENPKKVVQTANNKPKSVKTFSKKTGDNSSVMLIAVAIISLGVLFMIVLRKKKNDKKVN